MSMYLSIHEGVNVPTITFLADPPREDWNFEVRFGSSRRVAYASYEELKSAWFAIGAALSDYEDSQPIPFLPTPKVEAWAEHLTAQSWDNTDELAEIVVAGLPMPPAVAEFTSHRETRPRVDGVFALTPDVCVERLARHEWRWGTRTINGADPITRRYCVNCGTFFDGGRS